MLSPFFKLSDTVPATLSPPKNLGVLWEDPALLRTVRVAESFRKVEQKLCSAVLLATCVSAEDRGGPAALCPETTAEYRGNSGMGKSDDSKEYAGSCVCRLVF